MISTKSFASNVGGMYLSLWVPLHRRACVFSIRKSFGY